MRACLFAASLLLSLLPFAPAAAAGPARHLYVGVTIIDPATEAVQPDSYILVADGRIAQIGRGRPADVAGMIVHDFTGLYALPGLIDTHAHITLGPVRLVTGDGPPRMEAVRRPDIVAHNARHLLSFGVTTIRNPAGDMELNNAYSDQVEAGTLQGPEAFHAAEVIDRSPLAFDGLVVRPAPDLPVAEIVRRQAEAGADFIKLYTGLTVADLREGVAAAHARGLRTIAHLSDVSWTRAAELGVDALVHMMPGSPDLLPEDRRQAFLASRRPAGFAFFEWYEAADLDAPQVREMIETLARERISIDATLVAFQPAFWGDDEAMLSRDLAYFHPDMVTNWRTVFRFDLGWQPDDYRRARAVWPRVLELTRRLYEAGVPMTIGTDLANPFVAPGIGMAREMALHQQAGIPPWAVLRMATSEAASLLGIGNRVGRLAAGYEADILFIAADPRPELSRLAHVRAVINNGELLSPERLRRGE